ncbi:hypothetical protein NC652_011876 [Populus alba x Populus x berolinensis]|nr:hypothetical protein NC652_011876 [Populus alba x Populus x berolinensis]
MMMFLGLLLLYCCQDEILLTFPMTQMKKSLILRGIVFNRNSLQLSIGNHFSEGMKVSALGHQPGRDQARSSMEAIICTRTICY